MFYQIFLSPQVKRCAIITYKHGIYELPHELLNDLRLGILGYQEILGKCLNFINNRLVSRPPTKKKILLILPKNFPKIAIKLFP